MASSNGEMYSERGVTRPWPDAKVFVLISFIWQAMCRSLTNLARRKSLLMPV